MITNLQHKPLPLQGSLRARMISLLPQDKEVDSTAAPIDTTDQHAECLLTTSHPKPNSCLSHIPASSTQPLNVQAASSLKHDSISHIDTIDESQVGYGWDRRFRHVNSTATITAQPDKQAEHAPNLLDTASPRAQEQLMLQKASKSIATTRFTSALLLHASACCKHAPGVNASFCMQKHSRTG